MTRASAAGRKAECGGHFEDSSPGCEATPIERSHEAIKNQTFPRRAQGGPGIEPASDREK